MFIATLPVLAWLFMMGVLVYLATSTPAPTAPVAFDSTRARAWTMTHTWGFDVAIMSSRTRQDSVLFGRRSQGGIEYADVLSTEQNVVLERPAPAFTKAFDDSSKMRKMSVLRGIGWPLRIVAIESHLWKQQPGKDFAVPRDQPIGIDGLFNDGLSNEALCTVVHVRWSALAGTLGGLLAVCLQLYFNIRFFAIARRARKGCCIRCGYNLNVAKCPECGFGEGASASHPVA